METLKDCFWSSQKGNEGTRIKKKRQTKKFLDLVIKDQIFKTFHHINKQDKSGKRPDLEASTHLHRNRREASPQELPSRRTNSQCPPVEATAPERRPQGLNPRERTATKRHKRGALPLLARKRQGSAAAGRGKEAPLSQKLRHWFQRSNLPLPSVEMHKPKSWKEINSGQIERTG